MAQATVDLALNNAAFLSGLGEAERHTRGFESTLSGLFRRTPFARAERALAGFAAALGSGNIGSAFALLGARMTGIGLVAGVAIGAATGFIQKFTQEAKAAADATRKLGVDIATAGGVHSPDQARQKFQEIIGGTEEQLQKSDTFGNRTANFLDSVVNPLLGTTSRGRGNDQASAAAAGIRKAGQLLGEQADIEDRVAKTKEKQNTLDKISLEAAIKKSRIDEEALKFKLSLFDPRIAGVISPGARDKLITNSQDAANRRKATVDQEAAFDAAVSQRSQFQQAVHGFNPQSAALTEAFLRDKISADPNAPGVKQLQLQADQLNLFRQNAALDELKGIDFRSSPHDTAGRAFQDNLRQKIAAQQQAVSDQTKKVFGEQDDVGAHAVVEAITGLSQKMDEYWK